MPTKGKRKIDRQTFLTVASQLRGGTPIRAVAQANNLSFESVRTIKKTKTWPAFERYKAAKRNQRMLVTVKQAKATGPVHVTVDDLDLNEPVEVPVNVPSFEERLQAQLDRIERKIDTRLDQPQLFIERRLDNIDQGVALIYKKLRSKTRWWRRG